MKKLIEKVEYDSLTGLPMVEDVRGNLHVLEWTNSVNCHNVPRIYLQTDLKNGTWGSSTVFNRIPDSIHPGNYLVYTVPDGYEFNLAFFISAACQRGADTGISVLALYVDDVYRFGIPFFREISYKLYSPLQFPGGSKLEFKFKPGTKNTDFGMIAGGHIIRK